MRKLFLSNLALNNIKNNYRFFIPSILTTCGLVAFFYIVLTLKLDKDIANASQTIPIFMTLGVIVIAILSIVISLYFDSFIMKQRKSEFGLYNVLGLERKHVIKISVLESLYSLIISLFLGLIIGIIFYKISSLFICNILNRDIVKGFNYLSNNSIIYTFLFFIILGAFRCFVNFISIKKMSIVDLLKSKSFGEREPKSKILLVIIGIICLLLGYYMALSVDNPVSAVRLFFIAVPLVIIGTYLLFIFGSIWFIKKLKEKEKFYYKKNRMVSISTLLFRMKQNGIGLSSISILSLCIIIILSSTISLYAGAEDILNKNYKDDVYISASYISKEDEQIFLTEEEILSTIDNTINKLDLEYKTKNYGKYFETTFIYKKNNLLLDDLDKFSNHSNLSAFYFTTLEEFNKLTNQNIILNNDEILFSIIKSDKKNIDKTLIIDSEKYEIKDIVSFPMNYKQKNISEYGIVVKDETTFNMLFDLSNSFKRENDSSIIERLSIKFCDRNVFLRNGKNFNQDIEKELKNHIQSKNNYKENINIKIDSYVNSRNNLYDIYGTLLFLGIILDIVGLFAMVLIIYYKQISEGYEDRERFQILQKIGLCKEEIKKTIKSQIVIVFFLPLLVAFIHFIVAFPILTKLLNALNLYNTLLFMLVSVGVFVVYSIVYICIYKGTAKTYFKIVK